jgi:large subunit ribosomal protein LP2
MKHLAAYLLLRLGGNDSPSAEDITTALATVGVEVDDDNLTRLLADLDGKSLDELIAAGKPLTVKLGGGGGGGGAGPAAGAGESAAAEEKEEEKEEEEEMDMAGGIDMFGGDDGGGGGDY